MHNFLLAESRSAITMASYLGLPAPVFLLGSFHIRKQGLMSPKTDPSGPHYINPVVTHKGQAWFSLGGSSGVGEVNETWAMMKRRRG